MANKIWDFSNPSDYTYDNAKLLVENGIVKLKENISNIYAHWHLNETTNADLNTKIEIEVETSDGKKYTIYQNTMIFIPERIKWSTP